MVKKHEPSTPATGETPWKGRLRSHHASPLSSPSPWIPSRSRIRDEDEDARRFKKQAAPKTPGRRRCSHEQGDGSVRRSRRVRQSPRRQAGWDPEHPIVLDETDEECEVRGNQSAITFIRRSPRFHQGDKGLSKPLVENESHHKKTPWTPNPRDIAHNKKTQNAVKKDKKRENPTSIQRSAAVRASARIKEHKDLQILCQDSQDIPARRKTPDASCKKSEMQEPKPSCSEESTRKRKRGAERKPRRKQSQPETKSDCQGIVPITEPRNIINKKSGNDPSPLVQAKIGDDTLVNTKGCNEEPSGIKGGVQQQCCASDDWTEEQDLTLRQAYFTARPSPHFWKKVSKMGNLLKSASTEFMLTFQHPLQWPLVVEQVKHSFLL
ncbi:unnamed protein product [Alopecurus aequalis]